MLQNAMRNFQAWLQQCIDSNGGHMAIGQYKTPCLGVQKLISVVSKARPSRFNTQLSSLRPFSGIIGASLTVEADENRCPALLNHGYTADESVILQRAENATRPIFYIRTD
ncbi:hypothetical protein J6590_021255 [Homalodisca vitripennis]|nr:hypothetical protein J6590_021255 [Homalodisca vitripennis]